MTMNIKGTSLKTYVHHI